MFKITGCAMLILFVCTGMLRLARADTTVVIAVQRPVYFCLAGGALLNGKIILNCAGSMGGDGMPVCCVCLCIFAGCLWMADITDYLTCTVYNFVWWLGGISGIVLLIFCGKAVWTEKVLMLALTAAWQEIFFCRFYGRADSHAFLCCASILAALGMSVMECLLHMLYAYILLLCVQAVKHNINKRGNLKKPVPFLPYISAAFWLLIWERYR